MALNPVPDDLYPSSTQEGEAIPLAAVRPLGYYKLTTDLAFNLPDDVNLISFYATVDCEVTLAESTLNGGFKSNAFYALAEVSYELVVTKSVAVHFIGSGTAIINVLQKWKQLANSGTYYTS